LPQAPSSKTCFTAEYAEDAEEIWIIRATAPDIIDSDELEKSKSVILGDLGDLGGKTKKKTRRP
jgi:hypothetical protein